LSLTANFPNEEPENVRKQSQSLRIIEHQEFSILPFLHCHGTSNACHLPHSLSDKRVQDDNCGDRDHKNDDGVDVIVNLHMKLSEIKSRGKSFQQKVNFKFALGATNPSAMLEMLMITKSEE
jgi:hypothetical protein